jgi:amidase
VSHPSNPEHSAGGSSSGAAVLVASGVVPIARAKTAAVRSGPSRFIMNMEGSLLLQGNVAVDGVLTRTVRDTVALFGAAEASGRSSRRAPPLGRVSRRGRRLRMGR